MDERGIIIADRDAEYRSQIAEHFKKAGYAVETTDSAVHVLCSILEKQTPVLLLGSDFDKKVSSADLIHLLKKCNRHLHIIMVSEEMPLAEARKVRQEGIFYHALKPATPRDTEELGLAVECAFERNRGGEEDNGQPTQRQPTGSPDLPGRLEPVEEQSEPVPWSITLATLAALVAGASYLSLAAAERSWEGSHAAIRFFLGFCALIIVTQLLPIFRIKVPVSGSGKLPAKDEDSSRGDQQVPSRDDPDQGRERRET